MNCQFCGGSIIKDVDISGDIRLHCMMCGREPKQEGGNKMIDNTSSEKTEKKICRKCEQEKDIGEFRKNKYHTDGFDSICKKCLKYLENAWAEKREKKNMPKKNEKAKKGKSKRNYKAEYKRRKEEHTVKSLHKIVEKSLKKSIRAENIITADLELIKAFKKSTIMGFVNNDLIPALNKMVEEKFA